MEYFRNFRGQIMIHAALGRRMTEECQWHTGTVVVLVHTSILVPLVKGPNPAPGADPDVRPIAIGETDLSAITGQLYREAAPAAAAYLAPQQVAVGIRGGLSVLIHCTP